MKTILFIYMVLICISCNMEFKSGSQEQIHKEEIAILNKKIEKSKYVVPKIANRDISKFSQNIFEDEVFSYINIDKINGYYLRKIDFDHKIKYDFKKWKDYHYKYFNINESNYNAGYYLIAKQKDIYPDIFGVIDLRYSSINSSCGYLYTINKDLEMVDSIEVANFSCIGEEGSNCYSKEVINSHFNKNIIDIEKLFYSCFTNTDSCSLESKVIIKAKILENGKIEIIEGYKIEKHSS